MDEPRWLTDDQQRAWRALTAVMTTLPGELDRQLRADADMNQFEYWVLAMLSEAEGRSIQMKDLARRAHASASRVSHVVSRLEQRGWIVREPVPGDARAHHAVLTEEGWRKVVASAPGHVDAVRCFVFEDLTARDVADLARVASKIKDRLEAKGAPTGGAC